MTYEKAKEVLGINLDLGMCRGQLTDMLIINAAQEVHILNLNKEHYSNGPDERIKVLRMLSIDFAILKRKESLLTTLHSLSV